MNTRVFKRTQDNWYGNYKIEGDCRVSDLVEVSFLKLYGSSDDSMNWRVCVWGNDDFGLEKDFREESEAWNIFLQVVGQEYVNQSYLRGIGFIAA